MNALLGYITICGVWTRQFEPKGRGFTEVLIKNILSRGLELPLSIPYIWRLIIRAVACPEKLGGGQGIFPTRDHQNIFNLILI